jgi:hypothetical protein
LLQQIIWQMVETFGNGHLHGSSQNTPSVRTLIATNKGSRWFFVFGFEKNDRANITADELGAL